MPAYDEPWRASWQHVWFGAGGDYAAGQSAVGSGMLQLGVQGTRSHRTILNI